MSSFKQNNYSRTKMVISFRNLCYLLGKLGIEELTFDSCILVKGKLTSRIGYGIGLKRALKITDAYIYFMTKDLNPET